MAIDLSEEDDDEDEEFLTDFSFVDDVELSNSFFNKDLTVSGYVFLLSLSLF